MSPLCGRDWWGKIVSISIWGCDHYGCHLTIVGIVYLHINTPCFVSFCFCYVLFHSICAINPLMKRCWWHDAVHKCIFLSLCPRHNRKKKESVRQVRTWVTRNVWAKGLRNSFFFFRGAAALGGKEIFQFWNSLAPSDTQTIELWQLAECLVLFKCLSERLHLDMGYLDPWHR